MIPKIIHKSAPKNKSEWHPLWEKCHSSWEDNYSKSEYLHILWDDDTIDSFIKEKFNQYWELYDQFPFHILKLDFFRYCVLYEYGGIYADMDMYCYKNFYNELNGDLFLVQSSSVDEIVQNSLMCSTKNNEFFLQCLDEIERRFYASIFYKEKYKEKEYPIKFIDTFLFSFTVKKVTGPFLLSDVYKKHNNIFTLSYKEFNNHSLSYIESYKTKHMLTGRWGKDIGKNHTDYFSNSNFSKFDFRKNYIKEGSL
jgi:mannosyltransferase OCH1-like enzyme